MLLIEDVARGKIIGEILINAFRHSNKGIFNHKKMPESETPINVPRGSEEHIRFVTQIVAIDYLKDAHILWEYARRAYNSPKFSFLFDLNIASKQTKDVIANALKESKISQYYLKDAEIWKKIATDILSEMHGSIINFIRSCQFSGVNILKKIRLKSGTFPYLRGNKIGALWIRMLHDVCNVPFIDMDKIPIPVDVHIARATFTSGCISGKFRGSIMDLRERIEKYWFKVASISEFNAYEYDEPLWTLSKFGCKYYRNEFCLMKKECPISQFCSKGLINITTNKNGVFIDSIKVNDIFKI